MELGDQHLTVALFEQFPIRRKWHKDEWYYSVIDVMAPLSGSPNPRRYWSDLKRDIKTKEGIDVYALGVHILVLPSADGRSQRTDCAPIKTLLRLIQSVKSPNAEPIKQWLAQVGADRVEDGEDGDVRLRAERRRELAQMDRMLHELVTFRGIVTQEQHQALCDANYAGLYAVKNELALVKKRGIPIWTDRPEEYMGAKELAYNTFQRALTGDVVEKHNLQGEAAILAAAEDVGVQIRLTIERAGGTLPEDLPRYKFLTRGQWMTEAELEGSGGVDWNASDDDEDAPPQAIMYLES